MKSKIKTVLINLTNTSIRSKYLVGILEYSKVLPDEWKQDVALVNSKFSLERVRFTDTINYLTREQMELINHVITSTKFQVESVPTTKNEWEIEREAKNAD